MIVGLSEEELDTGAAALKKTPKNKSSGDKDQLPERKKFPTKVKVKYTLTLWLDIGVVIFLHFPFSSQILTQTILNTRKWGYMIDRESGVKLSHPKGPIIESAQPDFTFTRQPVQTDIRSYLEASEIRQVSLVDKHRGLP